MSILYTNHVKIVGKNESDAPQIVQVTRRTHNYFSNKVKHPEVALNFVTHNPPVNWQSTTSMVPGGRTKP